MARSARLSLTLIAALSLTLSGCGGSKADKAMKELMEIDIKTKELMKDAKKGSNVEKLEAEMSRVASNAMSHLTVVKEEFDAMTPEQQEAFLERWEKKFKDASLAYSREGMRKALSDEVFNRMKAASGQ